MAVNALTHSIRRRVTIRQLLGVAAALFGIPFNRSLLYAHLRIGNLSGRHVLLVIAAVGAATDLTGIVLTVEMTGNCNLMQPLLVACFCPLRAEICGGCIKAA